MMQVQVNSSLWVSAERSLILCDFWWSEVEKTCVGTYELLCSHELHVFFYLLINWCPVHWSSTNLPLPVFLIFHVNDYPRMLSDFLVSARELGVLLHSWLNFTIPFVHAMLRLDSCNRWTRFSHVPEVKWLLVKLFAAACSCSAAACLDPLVAWGLGWGFFIVFPCAGVL